MNDNGLRDPSTANCRIYVGNLKENMSKQELQNIFNKYGTIRGVMVSRNFGFVQFDNEASVNKAIESENQKAYNGRKIAVSKVQKKKPNEKGNNNSGGGGGGGGGAPFENNNQNAPNNMGMNSNAPEPVNVPPPNNNNPQNNNNNSNNSNNMGNMGNMGGNMGNMGNMQNAGNHQSRQQQWKPQNNNRNNRNNSRNNNNNSGNEMNLHTDRERSPFDARKSEILYSFILDTNACFLRARWK